MRGKGQVTNTLSAASPSSCWVSVPVAFFLPHAAAATLPTNIFVLHVSVMVCDEKLVLHVFNLKKDFFLESCLMPFIKEKL